jgi:hypothetical protein
MTNSKLHYINITIKFFNHYKISLIKKIIFEKLDCQLAICSHYIIVLTETGFEFFYQRSKVTRQFPGWWKDNEERFKELYDNYIPIPNCIRGWKLYRQSCRQKRPLNISLK